MYVTQHQPLQDSHKRMPCYNYSVGNRCINVICDTNWQVYVNIFVFNIQHYYPPSSIHIIVPLVSSAWKVGAIDEGILAQQPHQFDPLESGVCPCEIQGVELCGGQDHPEEWLSTVQSNSPNKL